MMPAVRDGSNRGGWGVGAMAGVHRQAADVGCRDPIRTWTEAVSWTRLVGILRRPSLVPDLRLDDAESVGERARP